MAPTTSSQTSSPARHHPYRRMEQRQLNRERMSSRNPSPTHAHQLRTIPAEDFARITKRREDLTLLLFLMKDPLSCHQLLFIDSLNTSIRKLEKIKQSIDEEANELKLAVQSRVNDLFEKDSTTQAFDYSNEYIRKFKNSLQVRQVEIRHESTPPLSSPLSSYRTAPSTFLRGTSPSSEAIRLAERFLEEFFPDGTPLPGLNGNPIVISDEDPDYLGSKHNPIDLGNDNDSGNH